MRSRHARPFAFAAVLAAGLLLPALALAHGVADKDAAFIEATRAADRPVSSTWAPSTW